MEQKRNKKINIKKFGNQEVIFLIVTTCVIGLTMGYLIGKGDTVSLKKDEMLEEFTTSYYDIVENYYKTVDEKELLSGAINGMLSVLDEHSTLIDETDETFNLSLEGSYSGVGIEIVNDENNNIYIIGVLENSPAEKAGIQKGDIVKSVDKINMIGKQISELSSYIRKNTKKSEFTLQIDRNGEEKSFNIKKENVVIKSVSSKVIEKDNQKIGYIYISIFSNTTATQFIDQLKKLEQQGITSLILDVRENSGGHLSTVARMLSYMMDTKKVIYQIEQNDKIKKYYSMGTINKEYPIVVLQNENSASASEMLAISLKENLNAKIIGTKSYGKGSVQELNYLTNGDSYKYTTKLWLSPNGNSIDEVGVLPDIEITLDEKFYTDPTDENDNQLQSAIFELVK